MSAQHSIGTLIIINIIIRIINILGEAEGDNNSIKAITVVKQGCSSTNSQAMPRPKTQDKVCVGTSLSNKN